MILGKQKGSLISSAIGMYQIGNDYKVKVNHGFRTEVLNFIVKKYSHEALNNAQFHNTINFDFNITLGIGVWI